MSPRALQFGRNLYAALPDELRLKVLPLIPALAGTVGDGHDEARAYIALDWVVRGYTPALLDLAGHHTDANSLRELPVVSDVTSEVAAGVVVRAAHDRIGVALRDAEQFSGGSLHSSLDLPRRQLREVASAAAHATSDGGWGPGQRRADLAIRAGDMAVGLACFDASNVSALEDVRLRAQESSIVLFRQMIDPSRE